MWQTRELQTNKHLSSHHLKAISDLIDPSYFQINHLRPPDIDPELTIPMQ